jgi:hypothetical protein
MLMVYILGNTGFSQTDSPPPPPPLTAQRASGSIRIDGILSESVWQTPPYTAFTQREPQENNKPTQETAVWVAYDEAALYIAARMYDTSPESLVVRLRRRDASWDSDMFAVFIDPYHDRRSGFYFALDAAGTYFDGTLFNDDWDEDSWDGVWEGNVRIDDTGWTAEMRIPFSQLRFHAAPQYVWGINVRRDVARRNERNYITFTPRGGSGFVSRFVDLVGMENITPARQVEILPYITARAQYSQTSPGNPFQNGSRYTPRFGADMKFGLGSNLTLDATVNPDFGQVEVDPAVVNLSDVETFFQEKRPFFIEGANIFNQFGVGGANNNWNFNWGGITYFYSRRIGRAPQGDVPSADYADVPSGTDILGAVKLTGKASENISIGTIHAITRREYARLQTGNERSEAEIEPLTYYGIARGLQEFGRGQHALGFMATYTNRMFQDDHLREQMNKSGLAVGVDGWTFLDDEKTWVVHGFTSVTQVTGSRERMVGLQRSSRRYFQRPDASHVGVDSNATSLTGYAARIRLNKQKGNFFLNSAIGFIDPNYEQNDLGFQSRSDIINGHIVASYRWTQPGSWYRYINLGAAIFESLDFEKNVTWKGVFHFGYIEFPNYYSLDWNFAYNPLTVNTRRTRGGPRTLNPPGYQIEVAPRTDYTKDIVVTPGFSTYQSDASRSSSVYLDVQWRPATNISITVSPSIERSYESAQYVTTVEDPLALHTFGRRYVFAELNQYTLSSSVRLNWTFTPKLSLQLYLQPLISAGDYGDFKELSRPQSYEFTVYGGNGSTILRNRGEYEIDPDAAGPAPSFTIANPNFNFRSLRGNAVLRWEYLPGSTMYFVWTQTRSDTEDIGELQFNRSLRKLVDAHPDNIFLIKIAYWWSN